MITGVEQIRNYNTPSMRALFSEKEAVTEQLTNIPQIQRLTMNALYPFATSNPPVPGDLPGDTRMKVHRDGQKPYNPTGEKHRDTFFQEATELVASYAHNFFDTSGQLRPDHQQEWFNLVEILPDLVRAITDRRDTEKRPYITMVQEQYALNILSLSLHLVQNPNADLLIRTGIGGSDNDFTTARFAGYGLPAVSVGEAVQDVYTKRDAMKLGQRAVERRVDREYPGLDQKAKRAKGKELMATTNPYEELTLDEIAQYRRAYAIRTRPVRIEFVFAPHAAEAVNSVDEQGMTAQAIHDRNKANRAALQAYIETYHTGISENVRYVIDTPWSEHTPFGKLQLEFFADLLQHADDPDIQATLELLQSRGSNRGGQIGRKKAAEYASVHPPLLGDRLNMPYTNTYVDRQGPREELLITIGGEPERHFNAVRQYLGINATPTALLAYIDRQISQASEEGNVQYAEQLMHMAGQVTKWQEMLHAKRDRHYLGGLTATPRSDLPIMQVPLICNIGETPVYYATDYDVPVGSSVDDHVNMLTAKIQALRGRRQALQSTGADEEEIRELSIAITTAERVKNDTKALAHDMRRREGVVSSR